MKVYLHPFMDGN